MNDMRKLMEVVGDRYDMGDQYASERSVRQVTNKLHQMMDDGMLDPRAVADAALAYLSEDDVKEMAHLNELIYDDDDELEEEIKSGVPGGRPFIDLSGPDGNAFVIMGRAKGYAKQLGLDGEAIIAEMQQSDYENLINVFEKYFGDYVDLYRGDSEVEESVEILGEGYNEMEEIAEELEEIKNHIADLMHEAGNLVDSTDESGAARAYWMGHILGALDNESEYMGGSMTTMQDSIDAIREDAGGMDDNEDTEID